MPTPQAPPLKIALVASEVAPFAKTGGLADVAAALARTLHRQGHAVRLFLPRYRELRGLDGDPAPVEGLQGLELEFPGRTVRWGLATTPLPDSEREDGEPLLVELVDSPELFDREGYYTSDEDEHLRWAALSRCVLEACQRTGWSPDVVHCNDWHTGLLPLFLRTNYAWDQLFESTRALLSIHNIGYQGVFSSEVIEGLGLSDARHLLKKEHLDDGQINYLATGVQFAHRLSTVSETYAREIQGEEYGMGLEGALRERAADLVGIVNGVDYGEWSPDVDPLIPHLYDAEDLSGKAKCKEALLRKMGLDHDLADPGAEPIVFGIVSRMTAQKGFELLPDILPVFLQRENMRLIVLGSGEERHERYFQWLRDTLPSKVGVYIGYQNELAHWIEAGSDVFLMPSRYEPCGLNQMYSLRYGTVPLVRRTGGLADTVEDWDPRARTGTGFVFDEFTPDGLYRAFERVLETWRDRDAWAGLVQRGMARDFSWERQSAHYLDLYRQMLPG